MKTIATSKNPYLKEGQEFYFATTSMGPLNANVLLDTDLKWYVRADLQNIWKDSGWYEEVIDIVEHKFSAFDVYDFLNHWNGEDFDQSDVYDALTEFVKETGRL